MKDELELLMGYLVIALAIFAVCYMTIWVHQP
jgi:hypothetical protein